jgi:hypothetical protein
LNYVIATVWIVKVSLSNFYDLAHLRNAVTGFIA